MGRESVFSLLKSRGLRPSKKRGQHFLTDPNVAGKILNAAQVAPCEVVVEVGAGLGALTADLADRARAVVAVEVDRGLANILAETFEHRGNVVVRSMDILSLDLTEVAEAHGVLRVKVIGNLPYCITAPILLWITRQAERVSEAVVMVQAEVAERLAASPGSKAFGPLTIAVQFWSVPEVLFRVSRGCFSPPPGVESALVRLRIPGEPRVDVGDREFYFNLVRKVFSQRRKMLKNSLLQLEGVDEGRLKWVERKTGLDLTLRPESLSLESFAVLAHALEARG